MTGIPHWLSPQIMRPLSWTLLHFLWQGCALAALLYSAMAAFRGARVRYAMAMITLMLMVAAPIATFLMIWNSGPSAPAFQATLSTISPAPAITEVGSNGVVATGSETVLPADRLLWLVEVWITGVFFLSVRSLGGFVLVERLRRTKASPAREGIQQLCLAVQKRIGISRAIQFSQCNGLDVPAVVGWLRPAVLLPMTALTGLSESQLEAVIAHELAHIKRFDYFANLFQIAAETLLFYHPAVWWVSRRIRAERENCCDDVAILVCGDAVSYARALTFMEGGRTAPAMALAANSSPFAARVMRLVGMSPSRGGVRSAGFVVSLCCLAGAFAIGNVFLGAAHAAPAQQSVPAVSIAPLPDAVVSIKPLPVVKPAVSVHPVLRLAQTAKPAPQPTAIPAKPEAAIAPAQPAGPAAPTIAPTPAMKATPAAPSSPDRANRGSYIDGMKSVGLDNLSADQLIALKIQNVTPDYVRAMREIGLQPHIEELIALRIQGATPEYVKAVRAAGLNPDVEKVIAMKIQSVTPEYLSQVRSLGLKASADDLIAMRIQNVSPEYIQAIRADGLTPTMDQFIAMRIQGVTPAYVKGMRAAGLSNLTIDQLIGAKIQGITPEFVEKARSHGFKDLDLDKLMALKNADVF